MQSGKYAVHDKRDQTESMNYVIGRKIGTNKMDMSDVRNMSNDSNRNREITLNA